MNSANLKKAASAFGAGLRSALKYILVFTACTWFCTSVSVPSPVIIQFPQALSVSGALAFLAFYKVWFITLTQIMLLFAAYDALK